MFQKISIYIQSLCLYVYYWCCNRAATKAAKFDLSSPVFVSLTTYNKRIDTVYLTIESIFAQSRLPAGVTLWLSNQDITERELPASIVRLTKRGLKVKFVDENIRSYKKLYYEYLEHKDSSRGDIKFVTADDDVFYPRYWLDKMLEVSRRNASSIVCYRARCIKLDSSNKVTPYGSWPLGAQSTIGATSKSYLGTGVCGIMYPLKSLSGLDIQKKLFMTLAPTADDIWFKCLTLNNHFKVTLVEDGTIHFPPVLSKAMKGLELENVGMERNDIQLQKVLSHFNIDVRDFS